MEHCKPAARGLLSLISLLRAFLLNVIKRNQALVAALFARLFDEQVVNEQLSVVRSIYLFEKRRVRIYERSSFNIRPTLGNGVICEKQFVRCSIALMMLRVPFSLF